MAPRAASNWRRPYTSTYTSNYRFGTNLYSDTLSAVEKKYSESISKTQLRSDRPDLGFSTFSGSALTSSAAPAAREIARPILSPSPSPDVGRSQAFESRLNATLKSAASALDEEDMEEAVRARIEKRRQALQKSMSEAAQKETTGDEDEDFRRRMEIRKQALERARSTAEEVKSSRSAAVESSVEYVSKSNKTKEETVLRPTSLYDDAALFSLPKSSEKMGFDLDTTSKSRRKAGSNQAPTNGPSSQRWRDKGQELQEQVVSLEKSMSDGSTRLRSELSSLKSKYHSELSDLSGSVENTTQQASDLQRLCKRQESQLRELQTAYESAQKNIHETLDEMSVWQNKCKSLKKEMDRLREEIEVAVNRRSKA